VDRRSVRIRLTEKGRQIHDIVQGLYSKHTRTVERVRGINQPEFRSANAILMRLERFFSDNVKYRLYERDFFFVIKLPKLGRYRGISKALLQESLTRLCDHECVLGLGF